jgi:DnaJ family protein B protein 12
MNKDEALRCLEISKAKFKAGDSEGALKFVQKSMRLHETFEAQSWVMSSSAAFSTESL